MIAPQRHKERRAHSGYSLLFKCVQKEGDGGEKIITPACLEFAIKSRAAV